MSNLSELLPAGAGAKSATFVASGTLASGQTVALKSNGQVEAVSLTSVSSSTASKQSLPSGATSTDYPHVVYDTVNDKHVFCYEDSGNTNALTAVVATLSGTTFSFGTAVVVQTGHVDGYGGVALTYDASAGKVVVYYSRNSDGQTGKARVGTVSGTSISFGTEATFVSSAEPNQMSAVYDVNAQKTAAFYRDGQNSSLATAIVGTVSGTSISFGSAVTISSTNAYDGVAVYDSLAQKIVWSFRNTVNSNYGTAVCATISGTSISFGSLHVFQSVSATYIGSAYNSNAGKTITVYQNSTANRGYGAILTVSGTSVTSAGQDSINTTQIGTLAATYNVAADKVVVAYNDIAQVGLYLNEITVAAGGGSFTASAIAVSPSVSIDNTPQTVTAAYDSLAKKVVFNYLANSSLNNAQLRTTAFTETNYTDFVGITDEAISSAASGSVVVQGGVGTGVSLPLAPVFGTESIFEAAAAYYMSATFDSANNKVVISYVDYGNSSYATAVVGTVSGTAITFGTPVIFDSSATSATSATFDSNLNKVVIAYKPTSSYGTSIVGTVSGTSISFGTAVVFNAANSSSPVAVFDSTNNKVVIVYTAPGSTNYPTAIVGTVSGTSISFGTAVVVDTVYTAWFYATFDSTNDKIVIAYADNGNSDYGTAIVGTVSGTSISFGAKAVFEAATVVYVTATFDSNAGKVVIGYRDDGNSSYGSAIVGTVSGTSISFGTAVVFNASASNYISSTYDSTNNKVMISYKDQAGVTGKLVVGSVSGTAISFDTPVVLNATETSFIGSTYDSNSNKVVVAYSDGASYIGTAIVANLTSALTIGTDYFVQTDGTLSTTSSTVPAGRALTTSSILLEG